MRIRLKNNPKIKGFSSGFNEHALNEVIVCLDVYDCDSFYLSEIEILIYGLWIDFNVAFRNKDIITDNYNTRFFKPMNWNDKKRGFTLY